MIMSNIQGLLSKYRNIPDERFFKDIFLGNEYFPVLQAKADVVVDIGACAGEFSAYIYDHAGIIYALEPYSEHYQELEENIREFGLTKIKPYRLAISDNNGEQALKVINRGAHSLSFVRDGKETTTQVPTKTLATFMTDEGIDYIDILKIDIESGEDTVFRAHDFVSIKDKIAMIIGEHLGRLADHLDSLGFKWEKEGSNFIFTKK